MVPIGVDTLGYDEALKADCNELAERLPASIADQAPYFEGFLVIQSPLSLDVTGVYSSAALDGNGGVRGHSSVDVEIIPERERRPSSDLAISKAATFQGETAPQHLVHHRGDQRQPGRGGGDRRLGPADDGGG